jgi:transcriptional regulator with XRE-family HTH domain
MHSDRAHAGASPAVTLKAFLKGKRDQLRPEMVGLPRRNLKRSSGLRREDIAELLGVTPLWYSLFESGTSRRRFSAAFLQRVQSALRLDETEYETLVGLAVASHSASPELELQWHSARWGRLRDYVSDVARRIDDESPERAADLARTSMHSVLVQLSTAV